MRPFLVAIVVASAAALEPVRATRRALVRAAPGAAAALALPLAAGARSAYEMELRSSPAAADDDMGALMGQFKEDLKASEAAKAKREAEEALPLQERLMVEAKKLQETPAARPPPGTSVPRAKKVKPRKLATETEDEYNARVAAMD